MSASAQMALETPAPAGAAAKAAFVSESKRSAMNTQTWDIEQAREEIITSTAGGAPFLFAFGFTLFASAIVSYFVPIHVAAVIVLFQGNLALPLAFWLERKLGIGTMRADNPLKSLSVLMALSQIVAIPAVILAYNLHPAYVGAALAAVGGGHFLPYAWLHRTRIYTILGIAVSVGAFAIVIVAKRESLPWVLFYMSILYWVAAPWLMIHSRRVAATARGTA